MKVPHVDGKNQWPYLMGQDASSPREHRGFLLSDTTYVSGNHKLICGNGGSIGPNFGDSSMLSWLEEGLMPPPNLMKYDTVNTTGVGAEAVQNFFHWGRDCTPNVTAGKTCCLFDLSTDVSESIDLMHQCSGGGDVCPTNDPHLCPTSNPYCTEPNLKIKSLYLELYAEYQVAKKGIWNPGRGEVQDGTCDALRNAGGFAAAYWDPEKMELSVSYPNGTEGNVNRPYWPGTMYEY